MALQIRIGRLPHDTELREKHLGNVSQSHVHREEEEQLLEESIAQLFFMLSYFKFMAEKHRAYTIHFDTGPSSATETDLHLLIPCEFSYFSITSKKFSANVLSTSLDATFDIM